MIGKSSSEELDTSEMKELHEPSATYARNTELPTFFGQPMLRGTFIELEQGQVVSDVAVPGLYYKHPHGEIWHDDAIAWLSSLESASADLLFADPPYNINKAEWDTFESQEAYVEWSLQWIEQAARVLKPTGTMYICGFSEILADLRLPASRFFKGCKWTMTEFG